jgi:NTE family protein
VKAAPSRPAGRPARARDGRPPSLGETLTRLLLLGSENTAQAARRHAHLVIRPHAVGVGLLEFGQLDRAREAGRAAAREALDRAPSSLVA